MTSYNVNVSIKLCLDAGKDFFLCNFGDRIIRGFKKPKRTLSGRRERKKHGSTGQDQWAIASIVDTSYKSFFGDIAKLFLHGI